MPTFRLAHRIAGFPVISCDIFDTALLRQLARPEDLLLAVGARARAARLVSCSPEAFQQYRLVAERMARAAAEAAGHDEVRILEVYQRLHGFGVVTDQDPAAAAKLADLEFAVERSVSRPVEAVRQALAERDPGQRLIFLSDTMLPGPWLATLLRDACYGEDCVVFSSADARRSKHTGRLYGHVLEALGCAPSAMVHLGDNPVSDIARAREHGITALHLPQPRRPPEPEALRQAHFLGRLAHSHRRSRVEAAGAATAQSPDANHAGLHHYFSLLLIGFTLFVLAEARRRGIRRIYFLSRDGHLPLAIARRLVARTGEPFEFRYLHISRQAIVGPSLIDDLPRLAVDISHRINGQPLSSALEFLGIEAATTAGLLRDIGIGPEQRLDQRSGLAPIHRLFAANAGLIRERLQHRRSAALAYLEQAGFLEPGPRLIVDVGWRGTTQTALGQLTGISPADIAGCYLGLLPQAFRAGLDLRTAAGYLFSFGHPKPLMDMVLEGYVLLELFCSAPHGSVLHYAEEAGRMMPVLATEQEPGASIRRLAFAEIEEGCLREFETLDAMLDGAWPKAIDPALAVHDLERLLTRPTAREVGRINRIPFIQGIDGAHNVVPVNPIPRHEWLLGLKATLARIENAPWPSGSARSALPWPLPSMTFRELRHRAERLSRLFGRA